MLLEMMQTGSAEPVRDPRAESARWGRPRREKREKRERPRREPRASSPDDAPAWFTWFGGARSVRIPIGYLFVAAALALGLSFVGYIVGFSRAEARLEAQRRSEVAKSVDDVVSDPLLADLPVNPTLLNGAGGATAATNERPVESNFTAPPRTQPAATPASSVPTIGDPRQAGMNYYIVAREHAAEAERVAAYLRSNGVDALVVEDSSPPWRLVVALRGFAPGTLSSDAALEYRSRLHTLGRAWKRDHRGTTDFSDAYAQKYQG